MHTLRFPLAEMTFVNLRLRKKPRVDITSAIHSLALFLVIIRASQWLNIPSQTIDTNPDVPVGRHIPAHQLAARVLSAALSRRDDVQVYIYSLPPKFNDLQVARSRQRPAPIRDPYCDTSFYSAEVRLHRTLLQSRARTRDPRTADFFYVPIYVTCFLINNHPNNLTKAGMFFDEGMQYVRLKFPFFNMSQGRDHVYMFGQGFGARLSGENWRQWRNGIFLTHNGDFTSDEYTPHKDIVVPPDLSHYVMPVYIDDERRDSLVLERRRFLAQFGGQAFSSSISDHRGRNYSGGTRQYLVSHLFNTPGFRITGTRSEHYLEDMRDSLFCLAPEGWHPWSPRPYYGILLGCVPVVLSDKQELAFEDVIPYGDLVVWVRPNDVLSLNAILRAIPVEDILHRLQIIEKIWPLFWYEKGNGAAVDAVLAQLARNKYPSHPRRRYLTTRRFGDARKPF